MPETNVWTLPAALAGLAVAGSLAGMYLSRTAALARRVVPFSGGVLLGIAVFWIVPEIGTRYSVAGTLAAAGAGFALLVLVDRYFIPVCPACSPGHEHETCSQRLHGFAPPLLLAAGVHSFLDGWSLALAQAQGSAELEVAFVLGIGLHKIPEGLALGMLFLAATGSFGKALLSCIAVQSMMLAGAGTAQAAASTLGPHWTGVFLAAAAGVFVYLGYHAIEAEYREHGWAPILLPTATGVAGAAALRLIPGI